VGEPVLIRRGGGEVIGDSPERRVEILSDDPAVNSTWSRFGPGREGADLHVHRGHSDLFYVLDGELTVRLGADDTPVVVPAGTLARVPPLVVHGFRNGSDSDMRYLNFHAPGMRFADYLRAVRDGRPFSYDQHPPPADGGRSPADAVIGGAELVVDRPGLRVSLLADIDEIGIAETWCAPGRLSEGRHVHARHVESLYVLDGELAVGADGGELRAEAGSWVQLPAGTPHELAATGEGTVRFLEVHTPGSGFGGLVRGDGAAFDRVPA